MARVQRSTVLHLTNGIGQLKNLQLERARTSQRASAERSYIHIQKKRMLIRNVDGICEGQTLIIAQ